MVEEFDHLSLNGRDDRHVPLKIYSCRGQGNFPIIIFSHGAGASKDFYRSLGYFWASRGYVCIHPTHADSLVQGDDLSGKGKKNFLELMGYVLKNSQAWVDRVADISLIIDSLSTIEIQEPRLKDKLDFHSIGVGGHSFGAYTAQLAGGVTITMPHTSEVRSFLDQRVRCLLLLSPQGIGQQGLTSNSWANMELPTMVVTGTEDRSAGGQGPEWRKTPFDLSPSGNKYFVLIQGAHHFSFGGNLTEEKSAGLLTQSNRNGMRFQNQDDEQTILSHVQDISMAFWDAHLKGDDKAKAYLVDLSSDLLSTEKITVMTR